VSPGASGRSMHVRVRYFAMQRQLLGRREESLELPGESSIEAAWGAITALHPELAPGFGSLRFARNGDYAGTEELLHDGDELAIIPPVAGGSGTGAAGATSDASPRVFLTTTPIDEAFVARLAGQVATDADGAVVTFVGRTRRSTGSPARGQEAEAARFSDQPVRELEYEAYEEMAQRVLEAIATEVADRFGVRGLAVIHRLGRVPVGEISVAICAASAHREQAFEACRYAIEELKARAPIWKAEHFADGSVWLGASDPEASSHASAGDQR
jgi:molybdopterin synthase catalytic subunit/molybdopterin converting factor small subunit